MKNEIIKIILAHSMQADIALYEEGYNKGRVACMAKELYKLFNSEISKRDKLIKAYSDLVIEIDKHKGTTIKEIKLRNKIANLKLEIR